MKLVIADVSSLILLEKTGLLKTLTEKFEFIISKEVKNEAVDKGKECKFPDAYKIDKLIKNNTIKVKNVNNKNMVEEISKSFNLGAGESESMALFLENKGDILATDDRLAINACKSIGIKTASSIAFIIESFEKGIIDKITADNMIKILASEGRYKYEIIFEALNKIGGDKNE